MNRIWIVGVVVAGSMLAAPAGVQADHVYDLRQDRGFGDVAIFDPWACNGGYYIRVAASVDDNGEVAGQVACSLADAACGPNAGGFCEASSYPFATIQSGLGNCSVQGNGGFWTSLDVWCSHGSEASDGGDVVAAPMTTSAHIIRRGGLVWGELCRDSCVVTTAHCEIGVATWKCWM